MKPTTDLYQRPCTEVICVCAAAAALWLQDHRGIQAIRVLHGKLAPGRWTVDTSTAEPVPAEPTGEQQPLGFTSELSSSHATRSAHDGSAAERDAEHTPRLRIQPFPYTEMLEERVRGGDLSTGRPSRARCL